MSHADHVILMVKKGIHADPVVSSTQALPAVMAKLTYQSRSLLVASVHLAPFRDGAAERTRQVAGVMSLAAKEQGPGLPVGEVPVIMAGDTNMRQSEDAGMERQEWTDFWHSAGRDPTTKFTWDTVDHGTSFNRYYGDSTREYTARYDRVYYHGGGAIPSSAPAGAAAGSVSADASKNNNSKNKNKKTVTLKVATFELIANTPVTNKYHFLSDHFGIATTLELEWPMDH